MADLKEEKDMAYTISEDGKEGIIRIAEDVVASIAGLAVTEVEGVARLAGNVPNDLVAKLGKKNLAKGVKVTMEEGRVRVDVSMYVRFGCNVMNVSKSVQEKVKQALLTMTGLEVAKVNVRVIGIQMGE